MAAVEVEVAPGLQLVKPPSSSLAASHRLHRPTSPQTHSHSLGENLTLVVRTKMKWEFDSVFQKHVGLKVHDLENRPLLKIWLSWVIWRAEGNCCSVQICSRVDVTWLCIFRAQRVAILLTTQNTVIRPNRLERCSSQSWDSTAILMIQGKTTLGWTRNSLGLTLAFVWGKTYWPTPEDYTNIAAL